MSYIGNPIVSTDFPVDYFSGNGSTTAFTLSVAPASVNSIDVQISGVAQSPQTYSVSGTTLTFSAAPPSGSSNIVVRHLGVAGVPNTPSAASVTQDKLASGVAGTGPAFSAYGSTDQNLSSGVATKVVINTEVFDTASCYDSSTNRFTPNVAGYYQVNAVVEGYAGGSTIVASTLSLYKNGVEFLRGNATNGITCTEVYDTLNTIMYMNGTTDYIELYMTIGSAGTITLYGSSKYKNFNACLVRSA